MVAAAAAAAAAATALLDAATAARASVRGDTGPLRCAGGCWYERPEVAPPGTMPTAVAAAAAAVAVAVAVAAAVVVAIAIAAPDSRRRRRSLTAASAASPLPPLPPTPGATPSNEPAEVVLPSISPALGREKRRRQGSSSEPRRRRARRSYAWSINVISRRPSLRRRRALKAARVWGLGVGSWDLSLSVQCFVRSFLLIALFSPDSILPATDPPPSPLPPSPPLPPSSPNQRQR